uniref:DUF1837 domain-containing protein n=1 Tax=Rhabditophanes sp. KR3021 TaxID=114890 RepID=A0AC35THW2_9BILA
MYEFDKTHDDFDVIISQCLHNDKKIKQSDLFSNTSYLQLLSGLMAMNGYDPDNGYSPPGIYNLALKVKCKSIDNIFNIRLPYTRTVCIKSSSESKNLKNGLIHTLALESELLSPKLNESQTQIKILIPTLLIKYPSNEDTLSSGRHSKTSDYVGLNDENGNEISCKDNRFEERLDSVRTLTKALFDLSYKYGLICILSIGEDEFKTYESAMNEIVHECYELTEAQDLDKE